MCHNFSPETTFIIKKNPQVRPQGRVRLLVSVAALRRAPTRPSLTDGCQAITKGFGVTKRIRIAPKQSCVTREWFTCIGLSCNGVLFGDSFVRKHTLPVNSLLQFESVPLRCSPPIHPGDGPTTERGSGHNLVLQYGDVAVALP